MGFEALCSYMRCSYIKKRVFHLKPLRIRDVTSTSLKPFDNS